MNNRRGFVDHMTERFRRDLEAGIDELEADGTSATMEQIEALVERIKTKLGRELEQGILDRQPDARANQVGCPACGGRARFHSVIERRLLSWHGEPVLPRRWYRCGCGGGFSPLDRQLGLDASATTPRLRQQLAEWASDRTFQQVVRDLRSSRGLEIGESTVERVAVGCGARLRKQSEQAAQAYEAADLPEPLHRPKTLYLSMDGVYAPLRDPWKKNGAAGALACRGGECKIGMAYAVERDRQGRPRVEWREYTATFQDIAAFRPQMAALAHRCGVDTAERVVFLADTLACNWTLAADYFPHAIQIVDWRHAVEHLETVQTAFFGETELGKRWLVARKEALWEGKAAGVATAIQELPVLPRETVEQAETRRREAAYFRTHQERMRYPTFREQGLQIGTGVMEASCRTVVNQRLDCSGMHWRQETADRMVALRAALLSTTRPEPRSYGFAA
jgi:hypothetical protein